jgi:hypothetical protein
MTRVMTRARVHARLTLQQSAAAEHTQVWTTAAATGANMVFRGQQRHLGLTGSTQLAGWLWGSPGVHQGPTAESRVHHACCASRVNTQGRWAGDTGVSAW